MVNSRTLEVSIGAIIKDPEMLRLVHNCIKICKHAAYKTQQICDKVILENSGMIIFAPDCYKDQNMCNIAVDKYAHALGSVPNCYKTPKLCNKAVSTYPSLIQFIPD